MPHSPSANAGERFLATLLLLSMAVVITGMGMIVVLGLVTGHLRGADRAPGLEPVRIAVSATRIDFGLVPLDGATVRQLLLRNDGPQPVHAEFSVPGSVFSVSPRELVLEPGIRTRISIVARADEPGDLANELHIRIDEQEPPLVIDLAGRADTGARSPEEPPETVRAARWRPSRQNDGPEGPRGGDSPHRALI